jgi:hypothetical protein
MYVVWKVTHYLGLEIVHAPREDTVASILWLDATKIPEDSVQPGMLNARCLDISKTRVDHVMQEVFGYGVEVDPRTHPGPIVAKSDANARHDGRLVESPVEPAPGTVYQRLVNNRVGDEVEDLRTVVVARSVPVVYTVRRSIAERFKNPTNARLCEPGEVFSGQELEKLLRVCSRMGLDFGEIDVLRDRDSGRLYVVDVNDTCFGPPKRLSRRESREAIRRIATAFAALLREPASAVADSRAPKRIRDKSAAESR